MENQMHLMIFTLDDQKLALPIHAIEKVVRIVYITPVTEAPPNFLGIVNISGQLVPVLDIRKCLKLPQKKISLSDQLIIAKSTKRNVAFVSDSVSGVIEWNRTEDSIAKNIVPGVGDIVENISNIEEEIILIYNIAKLFSLEDEESMKKLQNDLEQNKAGNNK